MGFMGAMAGLGALGGFFDAKSARKASNRTATGREDITTTREPWEASDWYRKNVMQAAQNRRDPKAWNVKGRNYGPSGQIQGMGKDLWAAATQPGQYQGSLDDFIGGTLGGRDQNPYRQQLEGDLRGYRGPSEIGQFVQGYGGWGAPGEYSAYDDPALGGGEQGDGTKRPFSSVGGQGYAPYSFFGGGGGGGGPSTQFGDAGFSGDVGGYLRDIAGGQYMQDDPFMARMQAISGGQYVDQEDPRVTAMIERQQQMLSDRFNEDVMPGLSEQAEQFGRFRGGEHAKARAMGDLAEAMGGVGVDIGYQNYQDRMQEMMQATGMGSQAYGSRVGEIMQSLGLGSQRDIAAMQSDLEKAKAQSAAQGSYRAAGVGARSAREQRDWQANQNARDRALQQRLSEQGFQMDALGMLSGGEQFGLGGRGQLASGFSGDQMGALQAAMGLSNQPYQNMLDAFGANFGVDQMRQQGAGMGYQQDLDRFRYQSQVPMQNLMQQAQLIEMLSGGYGTERRVGTSSNIQPYQGPSPWGAALAGGMGGAQLGGLFGGRD